MSNYNKHSTAYDLELFEPKESKVIRMPERTFKEKQVRRKASTRVFSIIIACSVALALLSVVLYSEVSLNEIGDNLIETKEALYVADTEYTRMQLELEAKTSMKNVEEYAKENLNMYKLEPNQIEFITVPDDVKLEEVDEIEKNFFEKAIDSIKDILS